MSFSPKHRHRAWSPALELAPGESRAQWGVGCRDVPFEIHQPDG